MKSFKVWNLLYVFAALAISLSLLIFTGESNSTIVAAPASPDHSQMAMAGMAMDDMTMPGMAMANMPGGQSALNSNSSTNQAVAASGPTVQVGQGGLNFEPKVITITARQTVTWNWVVGGHSVTSDTGLFDTGVINVTPHTFSFEFDTPGTYNYRIRSQG